MYAHTPDPILHIKAFNPECKSLWSNFLKANYCLQNFPEIGIALSYELCYSEYNDTTVR